MTGEIINNGMNSFEPIVDKLGDITTEFVPYIIGIAIAILGVSLTIGVVKWILGYLKKESMNSFSRQQMKERRRRRRRNRRFIKSVKNGTYKKI